MALKKYRVRVQSGRHEIETILKMTPEAAEAIGAKEFTKGKQRTPANKQRTPSNKASAPVTTEPAPQDDK